MQNEPRLLVVDDDALMATTLLDILRAKGYEVEAAYSGLGALDKLAEGKFDCVITDVRMPGYSGLELLQSLRIRRPLLPVVFMTAYSSPDLIGQALDEGATAVLTKPIEVDLLLRFLSTFKPPPSVYLITSDAACEQAIGASLRTQGLTVAEEREVPQPLRESDPAEQVMLLDLDSPDGSGRLQRLREECPEALILAVGSGEGPEIPEHDAEKLGAYAYLQKPIDPEVLLQLLRSIHVEQLRSLFHSQPNPGV